MRSMGDDMALALRRAKAYHPTPNGPDAAGASGAAW